MLVESVITIGLLGLGFQPERQTGDVYKTEVVPTVLIAENDGVIFLGAPATALPSGYSARINPFDTPVVPDVLGAFDEVGVERGLGNALLTLAKGILSEWNYDNVVVEPSVVTDPEELASYLTLRLYVEASFEETLGLDSALTRELVSRTSEIPPQISFAVYDLEELNS